jgi:translation elongation factor EF-Ts
MSGVEAEQIGMALEIINTNDEPDFVGKNERLKELREKWKKSVDNLERWMKNLVESRKNKK